MQKRRKPLKVTTDRAAQVPFIRVLIAIAVVYALIKTLQIHPALGLVYVVLAVLVFFHFKKRRKLIAEGVEMPSAYAAERFKAKQAAEAAAAAERGEAIDVEAVEIVDDEDNDNDDSEEMEDAEETEESVEAKKKSLPKRLGKSENE